MKKKVLHVINSLTIGGAEALLVNSLAPGGLPDNITNMLVYFHGESSLLDKIDKTVDVINLNYNGWLSLGKLMNRMREIIKTFKPDIIHTHLNPCDFYVNFIRPKHIPQVHTLHIAYSTDQETRPIFKFLEKTFFFKSPGCNLIFLSEFTKADFLANVDFKGDSFVLNNSIDDSFFNHDSKNYLYAPGKTLKLVAVGSIREQKNYMYLLEVFKFLRDYSIQLDIYGGGDSSKFEKIIEESELKIVFKGEVSDINKVIDQYDLFIMSSSNEGFPLSVFEAMAANTPVMISNIPPLKTIVKEHAIYFDLDDPKKVSKQILDIYFNIQDINRLALGARDYADNTVRRKTYLKELLNIYDTILERQPKKVNFI